MLRDFFKRIYRLYDVEDLVVGGHCGLCGAWMPDTIVEKVCGWGMCVKCAEAKDED